MRKVVNHQEGQICEWCKERIEIGEECIQSIRFRLYGHKWHINCNPENRRE